MIRRLLLGVALPVCIAFQTAAAPSAFAQAPVAGLVGVVRDSGSGQPVSEAQIVARNMNSGLSFSGVTRTNGSFTIPLEPGYYSVTATKSGFGRYSSTVKVSAKKTSQFDLVLTANPVSSAQLAAEMEVMKARIDQLEAELRAKNSQEDKAKGSLEKVTEAPKPEPALIATTSTEAGLLPRLPSAPPKPDELPLLMANAATPQAAAAAAVPPAAQSSQESASAAAAQKDHVNVPEALQQPEPGPAVDNFTFGAFGDFTWLNGQARNKDTVLDTKFFTPEVRFDTHYMEDFNQPVDHSIVGSTESFRSDEVQIEQISVGGDFHWQNVRGRILTMLGLFATTTPRNDASSCCPGIGQWNITNAYRYVSEAYGGYHFNVNHGLNVDAGIFVSYIGLFSYYNFDNWTYQPSYVSSNTPWFFNGVRLQWFPTNKLKIEPWFINGWQSYAKFNGHPGLGGQLLWLPKEWFKLVANQYGYGQDNIGLPKTERIHTDDSIEVRYYNNPSSNGISKMAFSLTADAGCQYGGGLTCTGSAKKGLKSSFLGWMLYDRIWFKKDLWAVTLGGGKMNNTGRYLTLLPPIDGANAFTGSPYFTENPGQPAHMWDSTVTLHYMPKQYITWWWEVGYRHSDIPYFAGREGVTPPGGNNLYPQYYTCNSGATSGFGDLPNATSACSSQGGVWFPDLRRSEAKLSMGVLVKF